MRCFPSFAFCKAFYNNLVSVWMSVRVVAIENESVFVECIFIYKCYLYSRLSGGGERKRKCRYRLSLFVLFLFFGGGLRFEGCQWSNSCRSFVPIVLLFLGSIQKKHLDCDHVCTEILNWLFFHYNCNFDSDK